MTAIEPPALRPLSLSQILDRAIRLYRQNFLVFIGIIAVMQVPVTIVQYVLYLWNYDNAQRMVGQLGPTPSMVEAFAAVGQSMGGIYYLILLLVDVVLVYCVAMGALSKAVEDGYMGRKVTIVGSYRQIGPVLLNLFVSMLIAFVLLLIFIIWTILPTCIGQLTGPGLTIFFNNVIFPLIPAIVVIERLGPFKSIVRAWDLTRRRFWWVLGFVFILWLLALLTRIGPLVLFNTFSESVITSLMPLADQGAVAAIQMGISQATTLLFQLIYLPIQMTAIILMYFDLRVRTEGFDLAVLVASEEEGQNIAEKTPDAPPQVSQSPITMNEAGYFAAISVGLLLLYIILVAVMFVGMMFLLGASRGL